MPKRCSLPNHRQQVHPATERVAFRHAARMQADTSAICWSFLRALRLIMLVACPLYLGMAATAEPLVLSLFGEVAGHGAVRRAARARDAVHDRAE